MTVPNETDAVRAGARERCQRCGGTDDLMDIAMAPGMTFCRVCRVARVDERLTRERDLLADALGRVLVAFGVVRDEPLTGPELLLAADDLARHLAAS